MSTDIAPSTATKRNRSSCRHSMFGTRGRTVPASVSAVAIRSAVNKLQHQKTVMCSRPSFGAIQLHKVCDMDVQTLAQTQNWNWKRTPPLRPSGVESLNMNVREHFDSSKFVGFLHPYLLSKEMSVYCTRLRPGENTRICAKGVLWIVEINDKNMYFAGI